MSEKIEEEKRREEEGEKRKEEEGQNEGGNEYGIGRMVKEE